MNAKWTTVLMILTVAAVAPAASNIVSPAAPGYACEDVLAGTTIGGFEFTNGGAVAWTGGALKLLDRATGAATADYGAPVYEDGTGAPLTYYNSFVRMESATSIWVGFTASGNVDDRIYQVDVSGASPVWTMKATLAGVQDLALFGGSAYAVGNPTASSFGTDATVYLLDTSDPDNADAHDALVYVGGYTAGLAMDEAGDLYYGTTGLGDDKLLRYSAAQLAGAVGAGALTIGDGEVLSDLAGAAYDVDVDSTGNVLFNMNGSENLVARWNGVIGSGLNYDVLARGVAGGWHWLTVLDADGDCSDLGGGTIYTGDYWNPGLGATTVPEPGCLMLLAGGALAALRRRRM